MQETGPSGAMTVGRVEFLSISSPLSLIQQLGSRCYGNSCAWLSGTDNTSISGTYCSLRSLVTTYPSQTPPAHPQSVQPSSGKVQELPPSLSESSELWGDSRRDTGAPAQPFQIKHLSEVFIEAAHPFLMQRKR